MSRNEAEITAQEEETEEPPIRLESISHAPPGNSRPGTGVEDDGTLSHLTSAMSSTYTSFTSFLNRGASGLSTATKKLPGQFQNLATDGTKMVANLTEGITDFISHGLPGLEGNEEWKEPSFEYLQVTYGIDSSDALIATFVCESRQTYGSVSNAFSPDIEVSFPIMISVTKESLCFVLEHSGSEYPGKITQEEILSLTFEPDSSLKLRLTDDRQLVLTAFKDANSRLHAFKLMQHLIPKQSDEAVSS